MWRTATFTERGSPVWPKLAKITGIVLFSALLALWGMVLRDDVNLTAGLLEEVKNIYVEIDGLNAVRVIGEDLWELSSGKVVRRSPVEDLKKIATKITGPSGVRTINAPEGSYDSEKGQLVLLNASGIWERPQYPMEWSTPQAVWDQKENLWTFPQGVTVSGDVYGLTGERAVVKNQQEIHVENGCLRWWKQ